jgi:5-formaminoimidazole-4-carboxamide-1-beta-D-ribofuranosyl 5'-monophosphate synthetase
MTAPLSGLFCVHYVVTVALEFRNFDAVLRGIGSSLIFRGYCCYHCLFVSMTAPLLGLICVHYVVTVALEFRVFDALLGVVMTVP